MMLSCKRRANLGQRFSRNVFPFADALLRLVEIYQPNLRQIRDEQNIGRRLREICFREIALHNVNRIKNDAKHIGQFDVVVVFFQPIAEKRGSFALDFAPAFDFIIEPFFHCLRWFFKETAPFLNRISEKRRQGGFNGSQAIYHV